MLVSHVPGTVRFHPLSFLAEDDDEVVIGRRDIDSYAVFPTDGAALVRQLQAGVPAPEAAAWYQRSYGEPVDLDEFVDELRLLGFVDDDEPALAAGPVGAPVRWQRLGAALFSPGAWVLYAAVAAAAVVACVSSPALAPHPGQVMFVDRFLVVELTILLGQVPLTLVHEMFHVLAGRRLGVRSRLRVAQRLHYVVFETVLDGLVIVPRRRRYLPIVAGIVADGVVMAVLVLVAAATRHGDGSVSGLGAVCLALMFTTLLRVVWQFYFYLRTDLYYLVSTAFGCVDLQGTTRTVIGNRFWAALGRRDRMADEDRWHPRDRRVARWFAPAVVAGYAASLLMLALVMAPLAWRFLSGAFDRVAAGPNGGDAGAFWDSAGLLALSVGQLVLAVALWWRDRRRSDRSPSRPQPGLALS